MSEPAADLDPNVDLNVDPNNPPADPPSDPPSDPPAFQWGDGWREHMASGDEKTLKELNEFTDPSGIYKGYKSLRTQRDSGEYVRALPKDPTDDELASWRKSHGIPETVDDYKLDSSKLGEEPDEGITSFVEDIRQAAYAQNLSPAQAQSVLDAAISNRQASIDAIAESDEADRVKGEDELRNMYGKDYRINMNLSSAMLDGESHEHKESFMNSRLPDGTLFKNSPQVQDMLVRMARQINPVSAIMPQGASDPASIQDEINSIMATRNTKPKEYDSAPVQKRLLELRTALQRQAG